MEKLGMGNIKDRIKGSKLFFYPFTGGTLNCGYIRFI
jgi:hypothetical protein